jgi:hypothetical protein
VASTPETFRSRIRDILLADWDPNNASRFEAARGEYDAFLSPMQDLILSDASEDQVVDFLYAREREVMCFPGLGKQRLYRVARKLLALRGADSAGKT